MEQSRQTGRRQSTWGAWTLSYASSQWNVLRRYRHWDCCAKRRAPFYDIRSAVVGHEPMVGNCHTVLMDIEVRCGQVHALYCTLSLSLQQWGRLDGFQQFVSGSSQCVDSLGCAHNDICSCADTRPTIFGVITPVTMFAGGRIFCTNAHLDAPACLNLMSSFL